MSDPKKMPEWLAKDCLDIGLFTNNLERMLDFWQHRVGITFDHMLPVGGGVRQHRHTYEGGVLKINHTRESLLAKLPGGYLRLLIAKPEIDQCIDLVDPDGNLVGLVPRGFEAIEHWAIEVATESADAFFAHYEQCLGLPRAPGHACAVACGRSLIIGSTRPELSASLPAESLKRRGYQYTTIQVDKVDAVHRRIVAGGGAEAAPPRTLGRTARVSFIADRYGNWMEISQRASITGSLDP